MKKYPLHQNALDDIIVRNGGVNVRDFPIFTTEYGVSSLVLKEIPYKKQAFMPVFYLVSSRYVAIISAVWKIIALGNL